MKRSSVPEDVHTALKQADERAFDPENESSDEGLFDIFPS
jgi:hypothetical protein